MEVEHGRSIYTCVLASNMGYKTENVHVRADTRMLEWVYPLSMLTLWMKTAWPEDRRLMREGDILYYLAKQ